MDELQHVPLDDDEAFELIDGHLDRQPLTDAQSDALTAWIKGDTRRADAAFYRIFLHSYLRVRLQAGILPGGPEVGALTDTSPDAGAETLTSLIVDGQANPPHRRRRWRGIGLIGIIAVSLMLGIAGLASWFRSTAIDVDDSDKLYVYEGFDYPATALTNPSAKDFKWPTVGGMQGLGGGQGWFEPWQETNSKVAIIVDYSQKDMHWEPKDMRKFGPLGYTDTLGNVLQATGHQMRTATSPRSITTRRFNINSFPDSMKDQQGLGRDGSVIWFSFLAQSSMSSADGNRYSYLVIGSKSVAGLRVGKLGAAPAGNWTAVGLLTGAEVNLRSSTFPSGEVVLFVVRVIFRPGPEDAVVWINPKLNAEPAVSEASLHLPVPDFRFGELSIHANHSTDFDEIRFGGTFHSVAPIKK